MPDLNAAPEPLEPTYTLAEARVILRRQECDRDGHRIDDRIMRNAAGSVCVHSLSCTHCGASFQEVTTP